jgi:hypothetical protein
MKSMEKSRDVEEVALPLRVLRRFSRWAAMKFITVAGILMCLYGLTGCFSENDAEAGKAGGEDPSCCQVGTSRAKLFTGSSSPTSGESTTHPIPEETSESK